jgi:signal transduction histidine kinase
VWNQEGATLSFDILPAFYQGVWFRLLAALLLVGVAVAGYRLRVARVARQLNGRFEERLAERTRIAQELHDTLLQGYISASMQLHVAADRLPSDSPVKPSVRRVLELMSKVIDEGRNALRGLRSSNDAGPDLAEAFSRAADELRGDDPPDCRVVVEGRVRPLNPLIRDDIFRIGREALVNAFRHSHAKSIEIELEYESSGLRMLVRDNGHGIDPQVLQSGSDGHWGLAGMRERAERIGARLRVWSGSSAGSEIELLVPGHVAFAQQGPPKRRPMAPAWLRFGNTARRSSRIEKPL